MLRRLIPLFVIVALVGALVGGYALYARRAQTRTVLQTLQQKYDSVLENRQSLETQTLQRDALKEQFDRVRQQVGEKIGKEALARIEAPICERWKTVAEGFSFEPLSCGPWMGRWQRMVLVGPTANKKKLYEALEAELHPVEVRACLISAFDESRLKIAIVMLDKYNDDPPIGQYLHFDPALLEPQTLPPGKPFEELVSKINEEIKTVRSLIQLAGETEEYKRKSALLLYALTILDGRQDKRFSLSAMEKEEETKAAPPTKQPNP